MVLCNVMVSLFRRKNIRIYGEEAAAPNLFAASETVRSIFTLVRLEVFVQRVINGIVAKAAVVRGLFP